MKKMISRSVSVVLALAMLFAMAVLFTGCLEDHLDYIGSYSGNNVDIGIYKHDSDGSLYCKINKYVDSHYYVFGDGTVSYNSGYKKINSNATQIAKIHLKSDAPWIPLVGTGHDYFYLTITLISGKFGDENSKIQTDLYYNQLAKYEWVENRYDIPFYLA